MNWSNHYTKKRMTMKAHGDNGRDYEVVCSGIPNPVRAYSIERQPYTRRPKRITIAVVPTTALAVMAAEQAERWEQSGDLNHEDADVATCAKTKRQKMEDGPRVTYELSIPVSQMITFQQNVPYDGLHIRINFTPEDNTPHEQNHPLPLNSIRSAIMAVNADLDKRGITPKLAEPKLMEPYSAADPFTMALLLFLQNNFQWDIEAHLLGNRWAKAGHNWADITTQHPTIFK